MRGLDFSSWQAVLSTLGGLAIITLLGVGIRLLVMQTLQARRERENRQINERLRTLMAAYKVLGGSFTGDLDVDPSHLRQLRERAHQHGISEPGSDRARRIRDAVEAALSDILLLGTDDQVRLAAHAATELSQGRPVHPCTGGFAARLHPWRAGPGAHSQRIGDSAPRPDTSRIRRRCQGPRRCRRARRQGRWWRRRWRRHGRDGRTGRRHGGRHPGRQRGAGIALTGYGSSTMGAKPPKIIRCPSNGIGLFAGSIRGSSIILAMPLSRVALSGHSTHENTTVSSSLAFTAP